VRLAAQGLRNMDGGDEAVADEAGRGALRQQARKVYIESLLTAAALTAAALAIP
jgi:hypothetical protein